MNLSKDSKDVISSIVVLSVLGLSLVGLLKIKEKYDSHKQKQQIEMVMQNQKQR